MATFLAHIKVHEGREAEFEILARDLFASTHTSEEQVVRYEYWRGAKPSTYYTHASFDDYLGFLEHQVSSFLAGSMGWRATFLLSAGVIALVAIALLIACPQRRPKGGMHYGEVLSSTFSQLGKYRVVRMRAFYQASMFAAFNLFWTAAPLSLIHDFGLGHNGIGAFALAGAGGALVAPVAGWLADRRLTGPASLGALIALSIGFLLADWTVAAGSLIGFTIMAVLIDAAVQVSQITGQKLIFSLDPHARGRINAAYMTVMFVVGALGSVIGSTTYEAGGWSLSAIAGAAIGGVAALVFILFDRGASATR